MDALDMEPLQFDDNDRVFLTRPQIETLLEYQQLLHAHEPELLRLFREGIRSGNDVFVHRARIGFKNAKIAKENAIKQRKERKRS